MAECNSIEHDIHETPNMYQNLNANISNDQQFRLNKINEIKDNFIAEIRKRELMSKNLSKYIASSDYLDINCFICSDWQHFHCNVCNCYWSICRNYECKL